MARFGAKFKILVLAIILASASLRQVALVSAGYITEEEFAKCVAAATSYPTSPERIREIAQTFDANAAQIGDIQSKLEAFIAVAQITWESLGFSVVEETPCKSEPRAWYCDSYDKVGCPAANRYHARGFIQMSDCSNYRAASLDLYGDDKLVQNPDLLSTDDSVAMETSLWFWKTKIRPTQGSTPWECNLRPDAPRGRENIYERCLKNSGNWDLIADKDPAVCNEVN